MVLNPLLNRFNSNTTEHAATHMHVHAKILDLDKSSKVSTVVLLGLVIVGDVRLV